jgi:toxin ParE1/3/4
VTRITLAPEVLDDFERFLDHMARFDVAEASGRIEEITRAIDVLAEHPLVGRPVRGGKRELVIGRDACGYVALYRYVARIDTVFVLAIRHQRERGYKRGGTPQPRS